MRIVLAVLLALGLTAGCGRVAATERDPSVVTAFYPLEFLSSRLAGDTMTVTNLTKPGAEPHDLELTAEQMGRISNATLVVHLAGFQPAVDEAVAQEAADRAFDVGSVVELLPAEADHDHGEEAPGEHADAAGSRDPHVWLDPVRFAEITDALGERLATVNPAHAADYRERAAGLHRDLDALNAEYAAGLRNCARREIVTSHTAFHYLADRYDLTEIGISGISPEAEPAPGRLAEVAHEARETGATTIFFETLVSPQVADTIAREVGATTAVLDPIEGLTQPGADYLTVMRGNLAALRQALGCT
ncbi:MAG TPA: metal ABC transporter substrate-binding protein [Actinoplanes sp.]|nr:metal ABC transporter substrate-binding protein [Actinoplanes sp.]